MTPRGFKTRPNVSPIDIDAYLDRLGVLKELPSLNYLKKLHRNHLLTFPFENLDVHHSRQIVLDVKRIYKKIIPTKRGGMCYELNLLFYHLLVHLGYDCHLISAKVWSRELLKYGPEYDHMAIVLKIQDTIFLCDVGFGRGFTYPKMLRGSEMQMDNNQYFKVTKDADDVLYLKRTFDGEVFENLYKFSLKFREPIEFIDMCNYHQTSEDSPFVKRKMMSKLTPLGRVTLSDDKMKIMEKGKAIEETILNEDAFYAKMEEHFGISRHSLLQA